MIMMLEKGITLREVGKKKPRPKHILGLCPYSHDKQDNLDEADKDKSHSLVYREIGSSPIEGSRDIAMTTRIQVLWRRKEKERMKEGLATCVQANMSNSDYIDIIYLWREKKGKE